MANKDQPAFPGNREYRDMLGMPRTTFEPGLTKFEEAVLRFYSSRIQGIFSGEIDREKVAKAAVEDALHIFSALDKFTK